MKKEKKNCDIKMRWECPECGYQELTSIKEMMKEAQDQIGDFENLESIDIPVCADCYNVMELDEEYMSKDF